jgi:hypothetical protein
MRNTFIYFTIGVVLIAGAPSIWAVYKHGFFESFNVEVITETIFSDNTKTSEIDVASIFLFKFLYILLTVIAGVIITPIRIVVGLLGLKNKMEMANFDQREIKKAVTITFLTCASSFIGGIVIAAILFNVVSPLVINNTHPESILNNYEILTLGKNHKAPHAEDSTFRYLVNDVVNVRVQKSGKADYRIQTSGTD